MMTVAFGDTTNPIYIEEVKNKNSIEHPQKPCSEFIAAPYINGKVVTFHSAMKLCVMLGQWFALNPVQGASENDTSKLRFKLYSARCLYTIFSITGQFVLVTFCMLKLFNDSDASLSSSTSIVFWGSNCLTTILFFRMAAKWPRLCQQIARSEAADPMMDPTLVKKCNIACIVILFAALLEHTFAVLSGFAAALDCQPDTYLYDAFLLQSFPWVWHFCDYNMFLGILCQFFNFQCTFNWNFADIFVICVSFYLTSRLDQVNQRVYAVRGKVVHSSFWRIMREDYSRVTNLVRKLDDAISGVIFVSFANNLFFICLQLLHTLEEGIKASPLCHNNFNVRPLRGYEQAVYLVYSFSFLVARSMAVSLIAAKVHTASRAAAHTLYDVPSDAYSIEVQRFLDQIHGDTVALSGMNFFNVKRGLVLTVAGTIVTYELVLMQFAGVTPTASPPLVSILSSTTRLASNTN